MSVYTEDEARTRWCSKCPRDPRDGANIGPGQCCIGSACMDWRVTTEFDDLPVGMEPKGEGWKKDGDPIGLGDATTHRQQWKRKCGYCGLSGKPSE